ncbi:hypothetical protein GIB67_034712 [Kingdonia uniflora]|uniref:Homeobox domain-containing protein n=1 Tax=Kingdonia uniflora TaxID=39325 RepID=A0A7J7MLA3_9MAGN|nr:hypothetical protein GIB67_034712 [Kingdonia uniflora]
MWRGVMKISESFGRGVRIRVDIGNKVRFWEDQWLLNSLLKDLYPLLFSLSDNHESSVQEVMNLGHTGMSWNLGFYRNLNDWELDLEMFGKDVVEHEHVSDDEDWGPSRRKRRGNEPDAAGTLVNLHGNGDGCTNVIPLEDKKKKKKTLVSDGKRTIFRIPPHAVEKLRRVFAENELPPRTVRLNLSKQLGIAFEKVNKWFKNSRYAALKIRKAEGTERPERTKIDNESSGEIGNIHSTNPVVSEVKSYLRPLITGVPLSKNLRKKRRKKPKSINMLASKKKQHKKAAGAVPNNINKVSTWSSKAVGMKKQRSNLQKEKKRANTKTEIRTFTDVEHQLYLREMERLFRLQDKLENMKKTILGLHSDSIEPRPPERPLVIYVPVAELRERV